MNYDQALRYLQSLPDMETGNQQTRLPNMTLGTIMSLLERLGNPQLNRTTIHVTGSKGKGSTAYFLANILNKAKVKTAMFTSPHLTSYLERFQVDLKPISPQLFADTLEQIKPVLDEEFSKNDRSLSTFGVLVLMFFQMVKNYEPKIDCQILEVGIGGRFDATNVFKTKDVAIITPISLEHTEILGNTINEIANNKAGIIKQGCTAVLSLQKDSAVSTVISRRCYEVGADFLDIGKKYKLVTKTHNSDSQIFQIVPTKPRDAACEFEFELSMLGTHQQVNATTAAMAALTLAEKGLKITLADIATGLKDTKVPGRFEELDFTKDDKEYKFILDGAHNQDSSRSLAQALKAKYPGAKFTFVLGINNDKNLHAIWNELSSLAQKVIITRSHNPRSFSTKTIKEVVSFHGMPENNIKTCENTQDAFKEALDMFSPDNIICVCGSLYVVGEIREFITPYPC